MASLAKRRRGWSYRVAAERNRDRRDGVLGVANIAAGMTFAQAFAASTDALRNWFELNVGPRVPIVSTVNGDVAINSQADADALVGKLVQGRILIYADDIDLGDFAVEWDRTGTGANLVQTIDGANGAHIHHFLLDGKMGNISYGLLGTSYSEDLLVEAGEIRGMGGDAIRTHKNSTYRHLYCHSFRDWQTARDGTFDPNGSQALFPHTDGLQNLRSGNTVEECWIENTKADNATSGVIVKSDADEQITSFAMRRCYVDGGGVPIYIDNQNSDIDSPGANGQPTGVVLEDILVGRQHREARAIRHDEVPSSSITKTNVRYADNGAAVEALFVDGFNRANENLEAGNYDRMSGVAGQLAVSSNQVRSVSIAAQGTYLLKTAAGVSLGDHFVEADWKSGTTTGWLIARYVDENNYVGMQILASVPTLYKRVAGTFTVLGGGATSLSAGDKIRIECRGQQVKLIHKGVLRVTATLGAGELTSGRVGMQSRTTVANPMCDNFAAGTLGV
jgi:hypothetical protein